MSLKTGAPEPTADVSGQARKPRLLFVDDRPAMLRQACAIVANQFDIVGAFSSGEAVLSRYGLLRPDVIVLDISLRGLNGLEVARILRQQGCRVPIVFLTVHSGGDFVSAALASGGSGYVLKARMRTDLLNAIQTALAGELFVSSSAR